MWEILEKIFPKYLVESLILFKLQPIYIIALRIKVADELTSLLLLSYVFNSHKPHLKTRAYVDTQNWSKSKIQIKRIKFGLNRFPQG